MHFYGWISERSEGSFIVKVIREDGILWTAFEARSYKKIQETAAKFLDEPDRVNFLWVDRLNDSAGFQQAKANYDKLNPIPFWGKLL